MDSLALIAVAADFDAVLRGSHFADVRHEPPHRYRLVFVAEGRPRSLVVSLRPQGPWVGRPSRVARRVEVPPDPFAAAAGRALRGTPVTHVAKGRGDRRLEIGLCCGRRIVAELGTNVPNVVLVGADGTVEAAARHPRSSRERLAVGARYIPPALPAGATVTIESSADELDAALVVRAEDSLGDAILRGWFAVGRTVADLVARESDRTGRTPGSLLAEHVAKLRDGREAPVLESRDDVLEVVARAQFDTARLRLCPWKPSWSEDDGWRRWSGASAAATVGEYYEARDRTAWREERTAGYVAVLQRERRRCEGAMRGAERDLASFCEPERHRLHAEALLAGLTSAVRRGDRIVVTNPYDGQPLEIAVEQGRSLTAAADALFAKHRRGLRGASSARARLAALAARLQRTDSLLERAGEVADEAALERLEDEMRAARIAVGLEPAEGRRNVPRRTAVRLEGVRLYEAADGTPILAGKSARDSDRLTFRLAGPEDFWMHAQDVAGAHVVLRNPDKRSRPDPQALQVAAAIAAWHSDLRSDPQVEVRWTRRKYVRRVRGAAPGRVTLKRFETVRVRPGLPKGQDEPV